MRRFLRDDLVYVFISFCLIVGNSCTEMDNFEFEKMETTGTILPPSEAPNQWLLAHIDIETTGLLPGYHETIDIGKRYQVKRITVNAGAALSLQMHHHRAEHWVDVSGTAKVTIGDKEILLSENQSSYIPLGVVHTLENPGKIPLELIEIQSGSYLGEDDIVRFEDQYGRS